MPVSPSYAENLATEASAHYAEAERILLERIGRNLAEGIDAPDWAERKLLQVQLLQAQTTAQLEQVTKRVSGDLAAVLVKAYNRGAGGAELDLADLIEQGLLEDGPPLPPGLPAVERLVSETLGQVTATHPRILRTVDDVFRSVIAETSPQVLLGVDTRRQAAQRALNRFAAKGVTGFVDSRGRGWDLTSYTEMAVRTSTANAAVQGHTDRLQASGHDLIIVSDAPQECPLCRPWEGKVLSLSGVSRVDVVDVAGTLAQARAAGLFHPNCRHSIAAYQPGVTKPPTRTADPEGDTARQELRYLERQTRAWKRREAVALDDAARERARAKVRTYQGRIRSHTASTPAKRQRQREQIGSAR